MYLHEVQGKRVQESPIFRIIQGNIFLLKYIQKVAQNHLYWSNFIDFIRCTGQNTCKKGIYSVSILRNGFRSMCASSEIHIFGTRIRKFTLQY